MTSEDEYYRQFLPGDPVSDLLKDLLELRDLAFQDAIATSRAKEANAKFTTAVFLLQRKHELPINPQVNIDADIKAEKERLKAAEVLKTNGPIEGQKAESKC